MAVQAVSYAHYTFDQLLEEEKKLTLKVDEEFKKKHHLNSCITKMSPAMLQVINVTFEKLGMVLRELEERRSELYKDCLGISLSKKLWGLRLATHCCFLASVGFVVASLVVDCNNGTPYELAAIAFATAGVGFSLLNQYGEDRYAAIREMQARLQKCAIDDLEGIEALNTFLGKFTQLVELVKPSDSIALKVSQVASLDTSSKPARSIFHFHWLHRNTQQVLNAAPEKKALPSRRKLAKKCIKKLNKIPNSLLEKYTGHKASYTREEWESAINDFTAFQENPYNSDDEGSEGDSSVASEDSEILEDNKEVIIDIKKIDNFSHLSLAKLIEQFNVLLRELDKKFNPINYLITNELESGQLVGELPNKHAPDNVRELIAKLKELHILICTRRDEYNRGGGCGCFSMKQKLTALHFCKYLTAVTSLCAVALSSASPCHYDYKAREVVKSLAIVAGLLSNLFEEINFWAGRKETEIKSEMAQLLDAEILDLNSIDQFNYFIIQFFDYVSDLPNTSDLDHSSDSQELSSEEQDFQKKDLYLPTLSTIESTVKTIRNTARRLSGFETFQQTLKRKLTRCLEALKAVDNTYLERIFDQKSAADTKRMWKSALINVYEKATGEIYHHQYPHSIILPGKEKIDNHSSINEITFCEEQSHLDSLIQHINESNLEKDIIEEEKEEFEENEN